MGLMSAMDDDEFWEIFNLHPDYLKQESAMPSRQWIEWAKNEFINITQNGGTSWPELICLVKTMAIAKALFDRAPGDGYTVTLGFRADVLASLVNNGYITAHPDKIDAISSGTSPYDISTQLATKQQLIKKESIDEWHPGMMSGAGWRDYYKLEKIGRAMAAKAFCAPAPPFAEADLTVSSAAFTNNNQIDVAVNVSAPKYPWQQEAPAELARPVEINNAPILNIPNPAETVTATSEAIERARDKAREEGIELGRLRERLEQSKIGEVPLPQNGDPTAKGHTVKTFMKFVGNRYPPGISESTARNILKPVSKMGTRMEGKNRIDIYDLEQSEKAGLDYIATKNENA